MLFHGDTIANLCNTVSWQLGLGGQICYADIHCSWKDIHHALNILSNFSVLWLRQLLFRMYVCVFKFTITIPKTNIWMFPQGILKYLHINEIACVLWKPGCRQQVVDTDVYFCNTLWLTYFKVYPKDGMWKWISLGKYKVYTFHTIRPQILNWMYSSATRT